MEKRTVHIFIYFVGQNAVCAIHRIVGKKGMQYTVVTVRASLACPIFAELLERERRRKNICQRIYGFHCWAKSVNIILRIQSSTMQNGVVAETKFAHCEYCANADAIVRFIRFSAMYSPTPPSTSSCAYHLPSSESFACKDGCVPPLGNYCSELLFSFEKVFGILHQTIGAEKLGWIVIFMVTFWLTIRANRIINCRILIARCLREC